MIINCKDFNFIHIFSHIIRIIIKDNSASSFLKSVNFHKIFFFLRRISPNNITKVYTRLSVGFIELYSVLDG